MALTYEEIVDRVLTVKRPVKVKDVHIMTKNPLHHVMLDLETFGTRPGCVIRSIGACTFDPFITDNIGEEFYCNVDRGSCESLGLHVDPDTERWWSERSKEARAALEPNPWPLRDALLSFTEWYGQVGAEQTWSHGAAFDVPVLDAAAYAAGLPVPWNYRAPRDTRTLYWLAKFRDDSVTKEGVEHDALHDAIRQARCVQAAMAKLTVETLDVTTPNVETLRWLS